MTDDRDPWWYSGDDQPGPGPDSDADPQPDAVGDAPPDSSAPGAPVPGLDWTMLAAGAQRLVDWATERVMAPHAEHDDPRAHPQCVVCRTMLVIGEQGASTDARPASDAPATPPRPDADSAADGTDAGHDRGTEPDDIVWIPIVEEFDGP